MVSTAQYGVVPTRPSGDGMPPSWARTRSALTVMPVYLETSLYVITCGSVLMPVSLTSCVSYFFHIVGRTADTVCVLGCRLWGWRTMS